MVVGVWSPETPGSPAPYQPILGSVYSAPFVKSYFPLFNSAHTNLTSFPLLSRITVHQFKINRLCSLSRIGFHIEWLLGDRILGKTALKPYCRLLNECLNLADAPVTHFRSSASLFPVWMQDWDVTTHHPLQNHKLNVPEAQRKLCAPEAQAQAEL